MYNGNITLVVTNAVAFLFFATTIVTPSQTVIASDDLVTDRPDQTESSISVAPGAVQIEFGFTHTRIETLAGDIKFNDFPQTLVRVGLTDILELRIGFAGNSSINVPGVTEDINGFGDADIGAKLELWKENGSVPEAAIMASISIPIGEDGYTTDAVDPSARISLANTLSERISLGYNIGFATVTIPGAVEEKQVFGIYTVALGFDLAPKVGGFLELFGDIRLDDDGKPTHSVDGGLTYLLAERTQLDLAGGLGISSESPDWFITTGLSIRLFK